jgi:DNA-binding response OmpR family regulator
MTSRSILIIEDDADIASALYRGLEREGYEPRTEHSFDSGLEALSAGAFSAAIVDVMLGDESGLELVSEVRKAGIVVPILMLSALDSVEDRMKGLEAGANDYVVKPFAFDELVARLRVQEQRIAATRVVFDPELRQVSGQSRTNALTEREAEILAMLLADAGHPVSRWDIYDRFWPADGSASENLVDVYIGYLRRKLAPFPSVELKTIRNKGFVLTGLQPK